MTLTIRSGIEKIKKTCNKNLITIAIDSKGDFPFATSGPNEKKIYISSENHPLTLVINKIVIPQQTLK